MNWFKNLFSRRRHYAELSESIREHLEEKITDLMDEQACYAQLVDWLHPGGLACLYQAYCASCGTAYPGPFRVPPAPGRASYRAARRLRVADREVEPGEPIIEANHWPNPGPWIRLGWIEPNPLAHLPA